MMKNYVITISERFPKTHKRAGELTYFATKIKNGEKIHTIRTNYELWEKRITDINNGLALLSVRVWEGKPYRSKQKELFRYIAEKGIGIQKIVILCMNDIDAITELAKNDGLSIEDFTDWFKNYDISQPMAIIHFTSKRY
jgi:hypothetical protein